MFTHRNLKFQMIHVQFWNYANLKGGCKICIIYWVIPRYAFTFILIALQVLNRKLNHLKIAEFTAKLYAPFKTKEEDMKNAGKTAMLLVNCVYCFCVCYNCKIEMVSSGNETIREPHLINSKQNLQYCFKFLQRKTYFFKHREILCTTVDAWLYN